MSFEMLTPEKHGFHVAFELRPRENREQTEAQGMPVFEDIEYAILTMPGGGLVVDKEITPKLLHEWKHGDNMRKPPSPFALVAYGEWKEGREIPVNGTDIKNWPGVGPAQLKMCQGASVYTIEDLANANQDTMRRLGMGGVALAAKAKAYLESAITNKGAEAISSMQVKLEAMQAAIEKRDQQIDELTEQLNELTSPPKTLKLKKG
jgi:nucleotidyltransferase/DNA polymerase involved in DNA repair